MNKHKKRSNIRVETIIVLIIAACMVFLMNFMQDKLGDFARLEQEALLVEHDPNNLIHEQLAKEIINYRPVPCKMIEIYKPNLDIMMTLQFNPNELHKTDLTSHPELAELFYNNKEGHTKLTFGDKEEDIYFKWTDGTDGTNGEKYLIVIYATRRPVDNIWIFNFICYMILILVFFLLVRLHIGRYNDKIELYRSMSDDVKNQLRH